MFHAVLSRRGPLRCEQGVSCFRIMLLERTADGLLLSDRASRELRNLRIGLRSIKSLRQQPTRKQISEETDLK